MLLSGFTLLLPLTLAMPNSTIHWRDLSVATAKEPVQTLVHRHSGSARSGRLLGILGPSGAGKSSLLNALAGVLPTSTTVTGAIWEADETTSQSWTEVGVTAGTVALLEQDDAFFPELTVLETLRFTAALDGVATGVLTEQSQALLRRVGLEQLATRRVGERRIGTSLRGISGGERRRLAVASAIAGEESRAERTRTPVPTTKHILADEPTTGLDAFQAERVVRLLKSLARSRACVAITTLHQPRGSIWRLLDDVMLMAPGGHVVYLGPRTGALGYFGALGFEPPAEAEASAAEFLIDLVSTNSEDGEAARRDRARIATLTSAFRAHQAEQAAARPPVPLRLGQQQLAPPAAPASSRPRVHPLRAFRELVARSLVQNARDVRTNLLRLGSTVRAISAHGSNWPASDQQPVGAPRCYASAMLLHLSRSGVWSWARARVVVSVQVGLALIFGAQFGVLDGGGPPTARSVSSRVALLSYGVISMGMLATSA